MSRYTLRDLPGVYRVCAEVDARGGDTTQHLDAPDLAGHVFAGPYLAHDPTLGWVVSDERGVAGYIVGTAESTTFERWREQHWYPMLRRRHPLPSASSLAPDDARYLRFLHAPPRPHTPGLDAYPATLHTKIAPRLTGRGKGRELVAHLVDELTRRGVPGIHLDVAASNLAAIAFYERLGFREHRRDDDNRTMIRELA
ncbi:MAG: GNAT family N-acetyltransferase [Microbacterium sp.]